jgi:hypothetical protein
MPICGHHRGPTMPGTDPLNQEHCDTCNRIHENVVAIRLFLQGGIGPDGAYREGLKQEHDRLKAQVAEILADLNSGKHKTWDVIKLGLGIAGGAIAGYFTSK